MKKCLLFWLLFTPVFCLQTIAQTLPKIMPLPNRVVRTQQPTYQRAASCTIDSIVLTTQAAINNFATSYPACTTPSFLIIDGRNATPAITNLNGLGGLSMVTKKLKITYTSITTISQLNSITFIDTLEVDHNPLLSNCQLTNLTSLGTIRFTNLPQLNTVAGLSNQIDTLMGGIYIDSVAFIHLNGFSGFKHLRGDLQISNCSLTSLASLTNLHSLDGYLNLFNDTLLTTIGLNNLTATNGFLISTLPLLANINGLSHHLINKNIGTFWFINTPLLTNLSGMDSVHSAINFYIWFNNNLSSLQGLQGLAGNVPFGFSLWQNEVLADITALSGIIEISDDRVEIRNNDALTNLTGLQNITLMGNGLHVFENDYLDSLGQLNPNLIIQSINDSVRIFENANLALCSFAPLCNYLNAGGSAEIHNNATGCNTAAEVLASCGCTAGSQKTWKGLVSNDWNNNQNWTPAGVPAACSIVTIPDANTTPNSPLAQGNITIGGLVMENNAELDMDDYKITIANKLQLSNAFIFGADSVVAKRVYQPTISNTLIEGNFSLLDYGGVTLIASNVFNGNTLLSDSIGRSENSFAYLNQFNGNLTLTLNSNYGNMYLANAGSSQSDYVLGNLTLNNNSSGGLNVGLGGGNPIKLNGSLITNSNNGSIDLVNITFVNSLSVDIVQQGSVPISIERLYMQNNNGGYVVLNHPVHIKNELNFFNLGGFIATGNSQLLVLENNCICVFPTLGSGYGILGPIKKIGNQAFTFPTAQIDATSTAYTAPISISAPALPTDEFTAQYFHKNPSLDGYDTAQYTNGFGGISGKEYWNLTRNNGSSNVTVGLSYTDSRSGAAFDVARLQVAGWNGSLWRNWGSSGNTGSPTNATIHSAVALTQYGPVTLSFKALRKPIITMGVVDSLPCLSGTFKVPFSLDTAMVAGNIFRVELSDSLGNFTNFNPTIGSKATVTSDTILCSFNGFLPFQLSYIKNYKIRVIGNLPPDTSTNVASIKITRQPSLPTIVGPSSTCFGIQKYYPLVPQAGATYNWSVSGGGSLTTLGDTAFVNWNTVGSFNLSCTPVNKCGTGSTRIVSINIFAPVPTTIPVVNNVGRRLFSSTAPANTGYNWYKNGTIINGATQSSYYAALAGSYTVRFGSFCGMGPASNSVVFAANSINQSIVFPAIGNKVFSDAPFALSATSSSGLPVAYAIVSGPITYNPITNLATITGVGNVTIVASQTGDNEYDTAAPISQNFSIAKASQTISFAAIANQSFGALPVQLLATASSGLPITYAVISGPAAVSGSQLMPTGVGTVVVRAVQNGDANYNAAASVDRSFCTSIATLSHIAGYTSLCPGTATYTTSNIPGATYQWRLAGGATLPSTTSSVSINWATTGSFQLLVTASGNCGNPSATDTLVVNVVNNILPDSVQSMFPANGAINQQLPLSLSWVPANLSLFYTFDVFIWEASLPQPSTPFVANLTAVNFSIPLSSGLAFNKMYKWMVVSHNGSCTNISTGPIQTFSLIPLPDLVVQNVQLPATAFSGQTIAINWVVKNMGPGKTTTNQSWTDAVFLCFDTTTSFTIPPQSNPNAFSVLDFPARALLVATRPNVSALDSGQQYSNSVIFTLPPNYSLPLYAYVITNYPLSSNAPLQVSVANDTARAPNAINITLSPTPDLRVDTVFTPASTFSGSSISLAYRVKNYGVLTPVGQAWTDRIYISQSPIFNASNAIPLTQPKANGTYYDGATPIAVGNSTQLLADSSYTRSLPVVVPNYLFGMYYVHVFTNQNGSLYEGALAGNNVANSQLQVFLTPTPQLVVSSLTVPLTAASTTQPIGVNWNIANNGFNDNIEQNKGHYFIKNGTCTFEGQPGFGNLIVDSLGFGSSYWVDRVYLSTSATGLNIANAILVNQTIQGQQFSGLNVSDTYPLIVGCKSPVTNSASFNANTFNVIKPGSNHPQSASFVLPDNLAAGNYYVYVLANAAKNVYEYPGMPQVRRSDLPLAIQRPDAVVASIAAPASVMGGVGVAIDYTLLNNGPGAVFNHSRNDRLFVSNSPIFDATAVVVATQSFTENIPIGTAVSHGFAYSFPLATAGSRYFYVQVNFDSSFRETNQANNISAPAAITVTTALPNDLLVSTIQLADTVYTSYTTTMAYTVQNSGAGTTAGIWVDSIFISCSSTFNPATAFAIATRSHNEIIPGGGSYRDSFNLQIPLGFFINSCFATSTQSTAYFFVKTNANHVVFEGSNTANNLAATGSRILINPLVDHIVTSVNGGDTATVGRPYPVSWVVKNIGTNPLSNSYYVNWADAICFSPDSVFNTNAVFANFYFENNQLATNQTYAELKTVTPPILPTGDYYVLAVSNYTNNIPAEIQRSNNANTIRNAAGVAKKIRVIQPLLPDLTDSITQAPTIVAVGQQLALQNRVSNTGAGPTFPNSWTDNVWLSADYIPGNAGDILLFSKTHIGLLQPNGFYNDSISANIALNVAAGNYILIHQSNAANTVFESNANNNLSFRFITIFKPAPADLRVQNITRPDTVLLGYSIDTVKWVVQNIAANTAFGSTADGVYLSSSALLDSASTLLGIVNKTINIGPLAMQAVSLSPLVMGVTEGAYNLIVKTDLLDNIIETDKTNNTAVAAMPIYVGVKELKINVQEANTLAGVARFYKLIVPDSLNAATIRVSLQSNDSLTRVNQLFIAKGYVPNAGRFDYAFGTPNYGNQDIVMSDVTPGTYYITVRTVSTNPNPAVQLIKLKAVRLPFAILQVQSASGGNTGNVTIKIIGSLFANNMVATLSKTGITLAASNVFYVNSTLVYATFNLQAKPFGLYTLSLTKPDAAIAMLPNSFSIVNTNNGGLITGSGPNTGAGNGNEPGCYPGAPSGLNSQVVTELIVPEKVNGGWPFVIQINYSNPTNVDVPAQVKTLYSERGIKMSLDRANVENGTTALVLQLIEPGGPPGIIRAGGSGSITIYSRAPVTVPAHTIVVYNLK